MKATSRVENTCSIFPPEDGKRRLFVRSGRSLRKSGVLLYAGLWMSLVAGLVFVGWAISHYPVVAEVHPCRLKQLTGQPCGTCGSTRTFQLISQARLGQAFLMNPFVFTLCGVGVVYGLYLLGVGLRFWPLFELHLSGKQSKYLGFVVAGLFVVNWIYLIWMGR